MIKVVIVLIMLMGSGGYGAYAWITKLQSDNKVLQVNQAKLEGAVAEQEVAIKQQAADAAAPLSLSCAACEGSSGSNWAGSYRCCTKAKISPANRSVFPSPVFCPRKSDTSP